MTRIPLRSATQVTRTLALVTTVMTVVTTARAGGLSVGAEATAAPRAAAPAPAPAPDPAQPATVAVQPMHSEGSRIRYPRLTGFPNAAIRTKVNAIFVAREKQAHEDRQGCFDLIRDAGRRPSDTNFGVKIDVRYVSARYLSLDVRRSYDCAGPYPNDDIPEPLTVDLTTGDEVKWTALFKPGVWPEEGASDQPPALHALYRARYAKEGGRGAPECQRVAKEQLGNLFLRLDARHGLMVQPDFPHALQACADEIAFSAAELAPHVADAKFLADLRAAVGK